MTQELEIEKDLVRWSRHRWIFSVLMVFGLQIGGLYWAAQGDEEITELAIPPTRVVLGNGNLVSPPGVGVVDPLLFAAADIHGFSGHGWLEPKPWNYQYEGLRKKQDFLNFAEGEKIISRPPRRYKFHEASAGPIFAAGQGKAAQVRPPEEGRSRLRIEGPLRERTLMVEPTLSPQKGSDVLNNTVIEVGVNRDGLVASARLMERSRSKTADQEALGIARRLRFSPGTEEAPELTWGKLIFQWFAVDLLSTNAAPR